MERVRGGVSTPADTPDAAVADQAIRRIEGFLAGQEGDSLVLSGREVGSLLHYSLPHMLPPGVVDPRVRFEEGVAIVSVRVALDAFPSLPELSGVQEILPDTVPLEVRGRLEPFGDGTALRVESVEVSRIPLPRRVHPSVLEALGRRGEAGLAEDAVALPLPRGVRSVYIPGDRLVLRRGS